MVSSGISMELIIVVPNVESQSCQSFNIAKFHEMSCTSEFPQIFNKLIILHKLFATGVKTINIPTMVNFRFSILYNNTNCMNIKHKYLPAVCKTVLNLVYS